MSERTGALKDQAIAWLIRQRDETFEDWDGFEAWLATSAEHARLYHEMAAAEHELDALVEGVRWPQDDGRQAPANDVAPDRRRWIGGAIAASLALAAGVWTLWPSRDLYAVQTAAGERRTVQLADSRVELNGATRVMFDRHDPRYAVVDHGQAMFEVRHDAGHPFTVRAGDRTLVDAGTAFEVTRDRDGLEVAVSEGLVIADPAGQAVRIPAGARLTERHGSAEVTPVPPADVATWRQGQLVYDGVSIDRVAADLERNLGVPVKVATVARGRTLRGVLRLDGGADETMARLGAILGARVEKSGKGWVIGGP